WGQEGADLVVEALPRLDPPGRLEDEAIAVGHRRVGLLDAEAPGHQRGRLREGGGAVPPDEAEAAARARHARPPPEPLEQRATEAGADEPVRRAAGRP